MADSDEPFGQLPVPNLEERARLFLRAVHGERDFTNSEHYDAQNAILDAMAAHMASKSNLGMTEEPWGKPPGPAIEPGGHPVFTELAPPLPSAIDKRQEPERPPAPQARIAREARPSPTARVAASIATARPVPPRARKSAPLRSAPTHKTAKRRVVIWGTAVSSFAALCVLGGLALYRNQMATRSEFVTADSASEDTPQAEVAFKRGAPSAFQSERVDSDDIVNRVVDALLAMRPTPYFASGRPRPENLELSRAELVAQARAVIASGDIEAARAALTKLVEIGNVSAAVALGSTYDPSILDALGVRNIPPDVAKARVWYQRAQQMGAPEAGKLLDVLKSSESTKKP
jgi:hypothetical protein